MLHSHLFMHSCHCPLLQLTGEPLEQAAAEARRVVAFQTEIAKITVPVEELRIPEKLNNPVKKHYGGAHAESRRNRAWRTLC